MKKIVHKIKELTAAKKIRLAAALLLTAAMMVAVPTYAWFSQQQKAAEMYKVQYPNSLYINAAHREDQIFFDLDAVNVNKLLRDDDNNVIYYTDAACTTISPYIDNSDHSKGYVITSYTKVVRSQKYAFSVFGSNTQRFKLQLAYTNNNQFKYQIYEATEYPEAEKPADPDVEYVTNDNAHTMSRDIFSDDINMAGDITLYYVKSQNALSGNYLNIKSGSNDLLGQPSGSYYTNNYGNNTNVQERCVPIYWQSQEISVQNETSNKQFHNYFVLEVTWGDTRTAEKKETDMIAITVQRTN